MSRFWHVLSGERRAKKLVNLAVKKWDHDHLQIKESTHYKKIYPHIWNQYSVYFQAYSIYMSRLNIIAFVASACIASLFAAVAYTNFTLFYLPILFFLFPLGLSLINLLDKVEIPWIDENKTELLVKKGINEFYCFVVKDIYHAATTLYEYKVTARTRINASLISILCGMISALFVVVQNFMKE